MTQQVADYPPAAQPDLDGAREYVLARLARELSPNLLYHSIAHTRDEVVPAVEQLAAREGLAGEALLLLRTAAWFHDIGYVRQQAEHEAASAEIAGQVLPAYGYSTEQIKKIQGMIMATRLPQTPQSALEALLADADLSVIGSPDFAAINERLRLELATLGNGVTDKQWLSAQLAFLKGHRYLTSTARELWEDTKKENIARLQALLETYGPHNNESAQSRPATAS
jgi:uncharacterized protein